MPAFTFTAFATSVFDEFLEFARHGVRPFLNLFGLIPLALLGQTLVQLPEFRQVRS